MTSKIQTSFFIKSIKQNNQQKYNNSFKKKNTFRKKCSSGIILEEHFFRNVSGKCSSGSSGRTHNGSSGSLAVSPLSPFFPAPSALVFYPMVPLT